MRFQSVLRGITLLALFSGYGFAAPLAITFASSLLPTNQGQTLTFTATVANTSGSTAFLNGDALNIGAPLTVNDTRFFINFPLSLGAGQMFTAPIFDVLVPA